VGTSDETPAQLTDTGAVARFDVLFSGLLPRLYRRAALLVGTDGAVDAVHEVYLKLVRNPERVLEHAQPYAYVITALVSVIRDDWRHNWRWVPIAVVPDLVDVGAVEMQEARWHATWLLRHLSPGQAEAVLLVDLDGFTIDEAAAVLHVHRGTVSRARARALASLRGLLEDQHQ
jgi:DNA-directed RNA polymerase specialized sigma24 family protein